jgi:hypothetical protein
LGDLVYQRIILKWLSQKLGVKAGIRLDRLKIGFNGGVCKCGTKPSGSLGFVDQLIDY